MIRELTTATYADSSVEDGYVRTEPSEEWVGDLEFYMSEQTYAALWRAQLLPEVYDVLGQRPAGLHLIPASLIRAGEAGDLRRGLDLVEPEPSEYCIYPPCILPATVSHSEGFPLCAGHAELLQGWDDLVA